MNPINCRAELWSEAGAYYQIALTPGADDAQWDGEDPIGPRPFVNRAADFLNLRKLSIYGGSNEIQRNIIAKSVLGL